MRGRELAEYDLAILPYGTVAYPKCPDNPAFGSGAVVLVHMAVLVQSRYQLLAVVPTKRPVVSSPRYDLENGASLIKPRDVAATVKDCGMVVGNEGGGGFAT